MLGAFIKAVITAGLIIAIPICLLVMSMLGLSYKVFLALLAIVLPFVVIGLIYGYLANAD